MFLLDSKLKKDSFLVGELEICQLRLNNDERFPWLILIPQIPNLRDLHDIPEQQQQAVLAEINHCSSVLSDLVKADKMNVAALGNLVPQLHIHVIARKTNDIAWPQPVWSSGTPEAYGNAEKSRTINQITQAMKL